VPQCIHPVTRLPQQNYALGLMTEAIPPPTSCIPLQQSIQAKTPTSKCAEKRESKAIPIKDPNTKKDILLDLKTDVNNNNNVVETT
jgi:hypothetical protein